MLLAIADSKRIGFNQRVKRYCSYVIRDELSEWYETVPACLTKEVYPKHTMETRFAKVHASEWKWVGYDFDFVIQIQVL